MTAHLPSLNALATDWAGTPPGELDAALAAARARGADPIDLVTANPHDNGLIFPEEVLRTLADDALRNSGTVRVYTPDAFGQMPAREAVADFYRRRGAPADPTSIALAPGTSMAYFQALKLLTRPGDDVLAPQPGYPLFDNLCALAGLRLRHYHLTPDWRIDFDDLEFQITPRTRVLMLVSPHNPTGMTLDCNDLLQLAELCRRKRLAAILDEVFSEIPADRTVTVPRPAAGTFPLLITLNGFSKMFSLPGWKVAWMKVDGDDAIRLPFLRALEHLCDTFLPVNELVQAMIPGIFAAGDPAVTRHFADLLGERRQLALDLVPLPTRAPEAGVYLCPRLPDGVNDQAEAMRLLHERNVFVHPGFYYGLKGHLVMTTIATPDRLREGLRRMASAGE